MTDSAGIPWSGRHFQPNTASDDDGSAPESLMEAIRRFRAKEVGEVEVLDALRGARLLIPLVAHLGEEGASHAGHTVDKSAELAIVTVAGPDGRSVLPAFSSVDAMRQWNSNARPVPATAVRVALAAAAENTELIVVDATAPTEFVVRRPALWALAQSNPWVPSYADAQVAAAFADSTVAESTIVSISLESGDPDARLIGPETLAVLGITPGLERSALDALLSRLQNAWAADDVISAKVDSIGVRLEVAA